MSEAAPPSVGPEAPEVREVPGAAKLPGAPAAGSNKLVELVWRCFSSLRLSLGLLAALVLALIAGVFTNPRGESLAELERAFGGPGHVWHLFGGTMNPLVWSYRTFELTDVWRAWWVTLLLVLLALTLVAQALERLPRSWFLVRAPETRLERVPGAPGRASGPTTRSLAEVGALLSARGWSARVVDDAHVFAQRGLASRLGPGVVLVSLVLLLGAVVAGRFTAVEGTLDVPQGGGQADAMTVLRPDGTKLHQKLRDRGGRALLVRCDDFRLQELVPGRAQDYEADLRVFEDLGDGVPGRLLAQGTLGVDAALRAGGLTFRLVSHHQLDQDLRARLKVVDQRTGISHEVVVGSGEPIDPAEGLRYAVVAHDANYQGRGPAVQLSRVELPPGKTFDATDKLPEGAKSSTFWVSARAPAPDREGREDRFAFSFDKLTYVYAAGLRVGRDPSAPWFYLGCLLLCAGLGLAVSPSHRRLWARLGDGTLELAGAAHRDRAGFERELGALCAALGLDRKQPTALPKDPT